MAALMFYLRACNRRSLVVGSLLDWQSKPESNRYCEAEASQADQVLFSPGRLPVLS